MKEKVDVIQGGITSASREAIRPIFGRSKTLCFCNTQYAGGVCDRNVSCTGSTPAQTVNPTVDYALKNWGKTANVGAADDNYGHITASWMTKFMKDGGGSVAGTDFFPLDVTNFDEMAFSETVEREMIEAYFGRWDPAIEARILVLKALADLKWATWAMVQDAVSLLDFDFDK